MQNVVENRIVVDSEWRFNAPVEIMEKLNEPGYKEMGTGVFIPKECAYSYALERISWDEKLKKEFVEWFYSGNWIEVK